MHILVLSSNHPNFRHTYSHNTVLAVLLEALAKHVNKVSWAVVCPDDTLEQETRDRLAQRNVEFFADFSPDVEEAPVVPSTFSRVTQHVRRATFPRMDDDYPKFRDPVKTLAELKRSGADVFLLFWDTWFANLLPYLDGTPAFGYWAKPRHEAGFAGVEGVWKTLRHNGLIRAPRALGRRWILKRNLESQKVRHFQRAHNLRGASNICALDAKEHEFHTSDCSYIPNTWPDAFGDDWREKRNSESNNHGIFRIVGNIGSVNSTGNQFGINYMAKEVLPHLEVGFAEAPWVVNLYGRGTLAEESKRLLNHPHVSVKGFVDDIDREMLSNQVFLLCNNAGPYSGGYTRVIYALSSGSCLVAHEKLAASMPELRHRHNVLLGSCGRELAALVLEAYRDRNLRDDIGTAARETFESKYHPDVVAAQILNLIEKSLPHGS